MPDRREYRVERSGLAALIVLLPTAVVLLALGRGREATGLLLGWAAVGGSLFLGGWLLSRWIRPGMHFVEGQARLFALSTVKFPLLALAAYGAASLGFGAAVFFVAGALSVYLAMAVGAVWSLRSRG